MKSVLTKIVALMLVFSFVFAFAACKDKDPDETTTAEVTTVEGDTTTEPAATTDPAVTTDPNETTDPDETTNPDETTDPNATTAEPGETTTAGAGETTTAAAGINAPVNGSMVDVLKFYNEYANKMKTYQGKVTVTKKDGTTSEVVSVSPGFVRGQAEGLLPNDYSAKPTLTFVNGKSGDKTLARHLPRDDSNKLSEINPTGANGVKSATCVTSGSGWKVTIVFNDDQTSGATALRDKPKYVSKAMDTLDLTEDDLSPFKLKDATVIYTGCKIEAVFDSQGRMTKLDVSTPANIKGNLSLVGINLVKADVVGTYNGNYTFAY